MNFFSKSSKAASGSFFTRPWKELSGENNWEGLLDPLDEDLRKYIIHYGERVGAMEDAINGEEVSLNYLLSRCTEKDLFSYVGLEKNNPYKYEVKKFIIAKDGLAKYFPQLGVTQAWIGYIAVATDEMVKKEALGRRDILIVWRGTWSKLEAVLDFQDTLTKDLLIFGLEGLHFKLHEGFALLYWTLKDVVREEVKNLVDQYKDKEEISITIAGHGMGGALATLNAADLVHHKYNVVSDNPEKRCMVSAFTFASPKVGNEEFKNFFDNLKSRSLQALRMVNAVDMVPQWPPIRYYHVGEQLMLDSRKSKTLKSIREAGMGGTLQIAHQIEVYLHLVAGTQGTDNDFDLKGRRHIALLNKHGDYIATNTAKKNQIPSSWWVVEKKSMFQKDDGSWELDDTPKDSPQMN